MCGGRDLKSTLLFNPSADEHGWGALSDTAAVNSSERISAGRWPVWAWSEMSCYALLLSPIHHQWPPSNSLMCQRTTDTKSNTNMSQGEKKFSRKKKYHYMSGKRAVWGHTCAGQWITMIERNTIVDCCRRQVMKEKEERKKKKKTFLKKSPDLRSCYLRGIIPTDWLITPAILQPARPHPDTGVTKQGEETIPPRLNTVWEAQERTSCMRNLLYGSPLW